MPETGYTERKVLFSNQWVCDKVGNWTEITTAQFTGYNTAVKKCRMDYGGGTIDGAFYLRNRGFFNENTPLHTLLKRPAKGVRPVIDITKLP